MEVGWKKPTGLKITHGRADTYQTSHISQEVLVTGGDRQNHVSPGYGLWLHGTKWASPSEMTVQSSYGLGGDVVVVQAKQSHGDFCLICVLTDTCHACFPTSVITRGVWLVQGIMAAGGCIACRTESRLQKFQKQGGLQHSEVQMQMCLQSCKRRREVMRSQASAEIILEARKEIAQSSASFSHTELARCAVAVYCFPLRH